VDRALRRRCGGAVLAAAAVLGSLAACGGGGAVKPPPPSLGTVVDVTLPQAIRDLPLVRPDGSVTTLAAYRGGPVMIADFLTLCTDICPMISANTVALARALKADGQQGKVALLEISVDPHRDTPARLRAYQKLYGGPLPNWTLLSTSPADTKTLWKYFGVDYAREAEPKKHPSIDWLTRKPQTYDVSHTDALIFLDAAGQERFVVNADPNVEGRSVPVPLAKSLTEQGAALLTHPNPVDTWTVSQGLSVFSWLLKQELAAPK
jgi:cytochrome oxidase Cu insertion factor (SCO1/SenC/PrrC family)